MGRITGRIREGAAGSHTAVTQVIETVGVIAAGVADTIAKI